MKKTKVFDNVVKEFANNSFNINELLMRLSNCENWLGNDIYAKGCLKDRIKKGLILKTGEDIYLANYGDTSQQVELEEEVSNSNGIKLNEDLPEGITFNEDDSVKITYQNGELIQNAILNHPAYSYTRTAVPFAFLKTKPLTPNQITLDEIITRLIIIDQIDGTNLSSGFGSGSYLAIAKSIFDSNIEQMIAENRPIDNVTFRSIALRRSIIGDKIGTFFSVISKYISRTAFYVYEIEYGYPIYDSVLGDYLYLYIDELSKNNIKRIKKICDYEAYCLAINNYLNNLNSNLPENEKINNLVFDKIIWFSYKKANAKQKYI